MPATAPPTRAALRERLREAARNPKAAERSTALQALFVSHLRHAGARLEGLSVALYRAIPGELDLAPLEAALQSAGARAFYPRILAGQALEFAPASERSPEDWVSGPHGILEPGPDRAAVSPATLGIVIVPGLAFGKGGERLGRGGGYYDRFLPLAVSALRVALALDFQVLEELHQETHDQKVHWVLSPKHDIRMPQALDWLSRRRNPA